MKKQKVCFVTHSFLDKVWDYPVVILAQAFHITQQYFFKVCRKRDQKRKSPSQFSADSGVAALKPLSPGLTN